MAVAGEAQDLTRNDRGQITALNTPAGSYSFTYDNAGQMTGMNYPGGNASMAYNAAGQISNEQFGDSLGTQFSYGYDSNGRLDQRQGEGADWQYGYDAANRLTSANHGADDYGYQYDPNGNRLEGGQQYDEFNKLLSSQSTDYDHDANGNRIRQTDLETGDVTEYGYDALNRLTSAKFYPEGADTPAWNASYQYDAFNRRTGKTVSGAIVEDTEYLWFGSRLVAEYDSGASTPAKRYRYTENNFAPVSYSEGNNDFAVHSDYLDTPKALTDTSGNVVWNTVLSPYGNTVENTDPDGDGQAIAFNLRFPGQYHDRETGLYYNWNRTYDPESGRYIQGDPIGLYGGSNLYLYVDGNPTNHVDPLGLVKIGNCDINVYTGKTVCSETVGNEKNSCTFSSNGNVSCQGKRGPFMCEVEYDAEKDEVNFDWEVTTPGYNWVKTKYEAASIVLEVGADKVEAAAEDFMDRYNDKREDALDY